MTVPPWLGRQRFHRIGARRPIGSRVVLLGGGRRHMSDSRVKWHRGRVGLIVWLPARSGGPMEFRLGTQQRHSVVAVAMIAAATLIGLFLFDQRGAEHVDPLANLTETTDEEVLGPTTSETVAQNRSSGFVVVEDDGDSDATRTLATLRRSSSTDRPLRSTSATSPPTTAETTTTASTTTSTTAGPPSTTPTTATTSTSTTTIVTTTTKAKRCRGKNPKCDGDRPGPGD